MRILVALDFSDCSRLACRWALIRLSALGVTEVVFHHVADPEDVPAGQLGALERAVGRVRTFVAESADEIELPERVDVRYSVSRGRPASEILEAAGVHHTEMIVMGTNGRRGFDRLVLGSVAEAVVRTSPCTVVVVKPTHANSH